MPALAATPSGHGTHHGTTHHASLHTGGHHKHGHTHGRLTIERIEWNPTAVTTHGSIETLLTGAGVNAAMPIPTISSEYPTSIFVAALHTEMNEAIQRLRDWQETRGQDGMDSNQSRDSLGALAEVLESARKAALIVVTDQLETDWVSKSHSKESLYNLTLRILSDLVNTKEHLVNKSLETEVLQTKLPEMHKLNTNLLYYVKDADVNGFMTDIGTNSAAPSSSSSIVTVVTTSVSASDGASSSNQRTVGSLTTGRSSASSSAPAISGSATASSTTGSAAVMASASSVTNGKTASRAAPTESSSSATTTNSKSQTGKGSSGPSATTNH